MPAILMLARLTAQALAPVAFAAAKAGARAAVQGASALATNFAAKLGSKKDPA